MLYLLLTLCIAMAVTAKCRQNVNWHDMTTSAWLFNSLWRRFWLSLVFLSETAVHSLQRRNAHWQRNDYSHGIILKGQQLMRTELWLPHQSGNLVASLSHWLTHSFRDRRIPWAVRASSGPAKKFWLASCLLLCQVSVKSIFAVTLYVLYKYERGNRYSNLTF